MRTRRWSYRYAVVFRSDPEWAFAELGTTERLRYLVQSRWRPDVESYESADALEIVVELAGVADDDLAVELYEDAVVVEGSRRLGACADAVYHVSTIRQGPFRLELPLAAAVDAERVAARLERGLLRITLPKRAGGA